MVGVRAFCVERYAGLQPGIPEDDLNDDRNMLEHFEVFLI